MSDCAQEPSKLSKVKGQDPFSGWFDPSTILHGVAAALVFLMPVREVCSEPAVTSQSPAEAGRAPWTAPQTPAFPGAEGFGAHATDGRGGKVLIIDSLADDPRNPAPGTFRWACESQEGPRIVVFRTGGIIDHCSLGWGVDDNMTVYVDKEGNAPRNFTVQWCCLTEGLFKSIHQQGPHSMALTMRGGNVGPFTFLHNLLAHNNARNPRIVWGAAGEFINNVIYNDGIPDDWETARELDPAKANANDRDLDSAYDNIEVHVNSLFPNPEPLLL